jgi:hypothetical protein
MRVLLLTLLLFGIPARSESLIVGILGGWQRYDAPNRSVRKFALKLREEHLPNVSVDTFENHHLAAALERIEQWHREPGNSAGRLIVYGQSFGGAAAVRLDRELDKVGIPVCLSIHIDSVGTNDRLIPPNVGTAANFFQREGWLKGQPEIRAEDPAKTHIAGNFEFHYRGKEIEEQRESWARRTFFGTHLKMENDPALWDAVEKLVLEYVPK